MATYTQTAASRIRNLTTGSMLAGHFDSGRCDIQIDLCGIKLAIVEADGVRPESSSGPLTEEIDATCDRLRSLHSATSYPCWEPVRGVRKIFRDWGVDPSKYRPSSEALLRRVIKGHGFPRISNIVDTGNLSAIETCWPFGCYDRSKLSGPIQVRLGRTGEEYDGIGRGVIRLEGRPVFADAYGPFGSPISDSSRTMISESTAQLLAVVCAPPDSPDEVFVEGVSKFAERLVLWCGGITIQNRIVNFFFRGA